MDFTLPIDRLYESKTLLAFFHPQPTYSFHILLLPKENIPDLQTLGEDHTEFLQEVITTSQKLIADFELNQYGYRLIVNGGEFQEFPILHFHLISDKIITQTKDLS